MKKYVMTFLLAILVISLLGCNDSSSEEMFIYVENDLNKFVSDWKTAQNSEEKNNTTAVLAMPVNSSTQSAKLTIPISGPEGYYIAEIEALKNIYVYYYYPDGKGVDDFVLNSEMFIVNVSKNELFKIENDPGTIIISDKMKYDSHSKIIHINYEGKSILINCPDSFKFEEEKALMEKLKL